MLLLHVFLLFMCSNEVNFLLAFLWLAGILVLDAERHIIDALGEKLQNVNFALKQSWHKGFQCLHLQQSKLNSVYSLERLFSYHTHALPKPSGSHLAGCHCSVKPSSFIGSHWKTPPCHLFFFFALFNCWRREHYLFFTLWNGYC